MTCYTFWKMKCTSSFLKKIVRNDPPLAFCYEMIFSRHDSFLIRITLSVTIFFKKLFKADMVRLF